MPAARTLLVIGIHREELGFGREVVRGLDASEVDVLEVPHGLSGRRPLPDEAFRYRILHRALYLQLLPQLRPAHRLLIDLHTGFDAEGPSADLLCADLRLRACLEAGLEACACARTRRRSRVVVFGAPGRARVRTVIPAQLWNNAAFAYLGIELYLPARTAGQAAGAALARALIRLAAACAAAPAERLARPAPAQ